MPRSGSTIKNFFLFIGVLFIITIAIVPKRDQRKLDANTSAAQKSTEQPAVGKLPERPVTALYFALDASRSFHPGRAQHDSLYFRSVAAILAAVDSAATNLPGPQIQYIGLISSFSRKEEPICTLPAASGSMFRASRKPALVTLRNECRRKLEAVEPSELSDIHGALDAASQTLNSFNSARLKAIVAYSDLDEDYGGDPDFKRGELNLSGVCVAVYYDDLRTPALKDPTVLKRRSEAWRKDLKAAGAKNLLVAPVKSQSTASLLDFLADCI